MHESCTYTLSLLLRHLQLEQSRAIFDETDNKTYFLSKRNGRKPNTQTSLISPSHLFSYLVFIPSLIFWETPLLIHLFKDEQYVFFFWMMSFRLCSSRILIRYTHYSTVTVYFFAISSSILLFTTSCWVRFCSCSSPTNNITIQPVIKPKNLFSLQWTY